MSRLANRETIRVGLEPSYRAGATLDSSHAVRVEEHTPNLYEDVKFSEPTVVQANMVPQPHEFITSLYGVTLKCELKGSGTPGTPPEIGNLLKICGWSETIVPGTSVTYRPVSSGIPSGVYQGFMDGKLIESIGVRGDVTFALEGSERVMGSFTLKGHGNPVTDSSLVNDATSNLRGPKFQGASLTVDGFAAKVSQLDFVGGGNLTMPMEVNQSNGFGEIQHVAPRRITGSFNPEDELVATHDFHGKVRSNLSMAFTTGVLGSTPGNRVEISMPAIRYRDIAINEDSGIRRLGNNFEAYDSFGDDAVSIIFT